MGGNFAQGLGLWEKSQDFQEHRHNKMNSHQNQKASPPKNVGVISYEDMNTFTQN
jgi:ATP-dependent Clp protease adapter protein ClpS